ncbi:MAG: hypothetical protein KJI71_00990 [Patescibacteria group bacterium]|nr:hypothetical protein [Patescibacteria group bacterium]
MKKKIFITSLAIILLAILGLTNFPKIYSQSQSEIDKTVSYLKSQPQTAWSTIALAGAGDSGIDLNHLRSVPSDQKSTTAYAKYILALVAAGNNPTNFGDENYVEKLKSYYQEDQFGNTNLINDDIWAILALGSVGQENLSIVQKSKDYVLNHQNLDGGWSYDISISSSDTNDTAAAIMALLEAGVSDSSLAIQNAVSYLKSGQNSDGGFPYTSGSISDSCSDSWVISSIYKLGQVPTDLNWTKDGKNALDHLKSLQDEDGGSWWQSTGDNKFCSAYALTALLGKHYPAGTIYNSHRLRIEGLYSTVCEIDTNGGTAMDLIISGSKICGYNYSIIEYPGLGLYLAELGGETSWMYLVDNIPPTIGADNYYLEIGDETLWHSGQWLEKGWNLTKVELIESGDLVKIQVKYYDSTTGDWHSLEVGELKVEIGSSELTTNDLGQIEFSLASLEDGFYDVFVETQIINEEGYIRSEKESLKIGTVPPEHGVSLKVDVERLKVQTAGLQTTISFSISPDILDFGKLKPGESSTKDLTIDNQDTGIYLETEVSGASIFQENLDIDGEFWQVFSSGVEAGETKTLPIKIIIPKNYSGNFGLLEGELTFWAIKK